MMRYLRPGLLEKTGVSAFDDWAKTFGETVARWERNAAGQMVAKERFAKFKHVPEMIAAHYPGGLHWFIAQHLIFPDEGQTATDL